MRVLANLFLSVFLAAAALGVGNELLNRLWPLAAISGIRNLLDLSSVLLALLVYFGFAFDRHLPKLILLPPIAYLFWSLLDFWPLANWVGPEFYRLLGAGGQLLLGCLVLKLNRRRNKKQLLFVPAQFAGPGFSGRTFFRFCLLNILVLPLALGLLGFSAVSNLVERSTAGFVQLRPNGLYMTEKVYRRQGKTVRLAAMIHLGDKDYYADLLGSFSRGRSLILAEGVTDADGRLRNRFSYTRLADLLGLTSQEEIRFPGRLIAPGDLTKPAATAQRWPDILHADVDLRDFDQRTIAVLNALSRYLLDGKSLLTGYEEFNRWANEHITPDTERIIIQDLLVNRNARVVDYLHRALTSYDTVIIPWGALHMPGIERAVIKEGFTLSSSRQRLSIDFLQLAEKMLQGKSAALR